MLSFQPGSRFAPFHLLVALVACCSMVLAVVPAPVVAEDGCEEGFERAPGQRACTPIEPDVTIRQQPDESPPTTIPEPEIQPQGEETPEIGIQPRNINTPEPGTEPMPPESTQEPTTGVVRIFTLTCPPTYSGGFTSQSPCSPLPGALISVEANGTPIGAKHTTMYNTSAQTMFTVPAGPVTIHQSPPNAVASMRVWCAEYDKGGTPFTTAPTATGSSVTYTIPAGWWVHCYWLNTAHIEAVEFYFAEMHPWVCPLDTVKAVDVLQESCGPASGPVSFSVTDAAGTVWDARAAEGGFARVDQLPAGALSMTVVLPEGVEDAFVACQAMDGRGAPVGELAEVPLEVGSDSAMWQLDPAHGGGVVCHVFLLAGR